MPQFSSVVVAFQMHARKSIVRQMIEEIDTSDAPRLDDLRLALLAVPEWQTDTSDENV